MQKLATLLGIEKREFKSFFRLSIGMAAAYLLTLFFQLYRLYYPKYSLGTLEVVFNDERLTSNLFELVLWVGIFALLMAGTTMLYAGFRKRSWQLKTAIILWSSLLISFIFYNFPFAGETYCDGIGCHGYLSVIESIIDDKVFEISILILLAGFIIYPFIHLQVNKNKGRKTSFSLITLVIGGMAIMFLRDGMIFYRAIPEIIMNYPLIPVLIVFVPLFFLERRQKDQLKHSIPLHLWFIFSYIFIGTPYLTIFVFFIWFGLEKYYEFPILIPFFILWHFIVIAWPWILKKLKVGYTENPK